MHAKGVMTQKLRLLMVSPSPVVNTDAQPAGSR